MKTLLALTPSIVLGATVLPAATSAPAAKGRSIREAWSSLGRGRT
jgi:hypothetical protein